MILQLSNDLSRALSVSKYYFKINGNIEVFPIDKSALACPAAQTVEKKQGQHKRLELLSPSITITQGERGYILLSAHPELGGDMKIIPPSQGVVPEGWLTISTGRSKEFVGKLPYIFRVSILCIGHRNG